MNKITTTLVALLFPAVLGAAEVGVKTKGTILKIDRTENRFVLKTERGQETFDLTKATKGIEDAKEGAEVTVLFSEKDGASPRSARSFDIKTFVASSLLASEYQESKK